MSVTKIINIANSVDIDTFTNGHKLKNVPIIGAIIKAFQQTKQQFMDQVQSALDQIDKASSEIDKHGKIVASRSKDLQAIFEDNENDVQRMEQMVLLGRERQREIQQQAEELCVHAQQNPQNVQVVQQSRDIVMYLNNLDKHLFDLQTVVEDGQITSSEIREMQYSDQMLGAKLQSIITLTIPMWKKKIALAIKSNQQRASLDVVKAADDFTNQTIRNHADMVKKNTIDATIASQRAVIDTETVEYAHNQLLLTVDEVIRINNESQQKRDDGIKKFQDMRSQRQQKFTV
jgi:uncharacterized protein YaaN involved in tellurite resistance